MRALVLAALVAASPAIAGPKINQAPNGDYIRIYDSPCVHAGTLALLQEEDRKYFKKVDIVFGGKRVYGCWAEDVDGDVFILFEDGSRNGFYMEGFKEDHGV